MSKFPSYLDLGDDLVAEATNMLWYVRHYGEGLQISTAKWTLNNENSLKNDSGEHGVRIKIGDEACWWLGECWTWEAL